MSSALSEIHSPPSKNKWWRPFIKPIPLFDPSPTHSSNHHPSLDSSPGSDSATSVFGCRLEDSLERASVAISMIGADQKAYIYGFIPVVVAKCGLYLKEHGTSVEGIFRISGSTKRMRELQQIFDRPPFFGKELDWLNTVPGPADQQNSLDGSQKPYFSVHDAANVLRRYLMCLPEPLIPQTMYEDFREVLIQHATDKDKQVRLFKSLISTLSPSCQYLLLYLLDLLAVFANRAEMNLMTANNLAVVFQPALCPAAPPNAARLDRLIYRRPGDPAACQQESLQEQEAILREVKQAQTVLEFLILHQNYFVVGLRPQVKTLPRTGPPDGPGLSDWRRDEWPGTDGRATPRPSTGSQSRRRSKAHTHDAISPPGRANEIKRSRTMPSNNTSPAPNLEWSHSVGSPVPSNHDQTPHQQYTPIELTDNPIS